MDGEFITGVEPVAAAKDPHRCVSIYFFVPLNIYSVMLFARSLSTEMTLVSLDLVTGKYKLILSEKVLLLFRGAH